MDGVMGLGRNPLSLSTQLMTARQSSQVFSHCLGGEAEGGGTLVMGSVEEDGMSYTPMDSTRRWVVPTGYRDQHWNLGGEEIDHEVSA